MVESNPIALDRRLRRRISALFIAVVMALGMVAFNASQSAEAQTCQEQTRDHVDLILGYYMGSAVTKDSSLCSGLSISWTRSSGLHRGQYRTSSGVWQFSNVGARHLTAGTQNPWAVVILEGSTGTQFRAGSVHQAPLGRSTWRY